MSLITQVKRRNHTKGAVSLTNEGYLKKNSSARWEFNDIELTSGCTVEIQIDDDWICGVIEHWHDSYYWFSRRNGVPVVLHSGIRARLPVTKDRRSNPG